MSFNRLTSAIGSGSKGAQSKSSKANDDIDVLLKRIDEQNEQINRLQTKFRGFVFKKNKSKKIRTYFF